MKLIPDSWGRPITLGDARAPALIPVASEGRCELGVVTAARVVGRSMGVITAATWPAEPELGRSRGQVRDEVRDVAGARCRRRTARPGWLSHLTDGSSAVGETPGPLGGA